MTVPVSRDFPRLSTCENRPPLFSFSRHTQTHDKGRKEWDEARQTAYDVPRVGVRDIRMPHYFVRPDAFCSRPVSPHCAPFRGLAEDWKRRGSAKRTRPKSHRNERKRRSSAPQTASICAKRKGKTSVFT